MGPCLLESNDHGNAEGKCLTRAGGSTPEYVAALALLLVFTILLPGLLWTLFSKRRLAILP